MVVLAFFAGGLSKDVSALSVEDSNSDDGVFSCKNNYLLYSDSYMPSCSENYEITGNIENNWCQVNFSNTLASIKWKHGQKTSVA